MKFAKLYYTYIGAGLFKLLLKNFSALNSKLPPDFLNQLVLNRFEHVFRIKLVLILYINVGPNATYYKYTNTNEIRFILSNEYFKMLLPEINNNIMS